ncbi:hypothetical protein [Pedobacter sp. NJ-S-72]
MNYNSPKLPYIGVDIGGSHITAAHVDAADLKVIKSSLIRERVASMEGADVIIKSWVDALMPLIENQGEENYLYWYCYARTF